MGYIQERLAWCRTDSVLVLRLRCRAGLNRNSPRVFVKMTVHAEITMVSCDASRNSTPVEQQHFPSASAVTCQPGQACFVALRCCYKQRSFSLFWVCLHWFPLSLQRFQAQCT